MTVQNTFKTIICLVTLYSSVSSAQSYQDFDGTFYPDGPNCFNTSLRALSIEKTVRYVHDSEFKLILKSQCRLILSKVELAIRTKPFLGVINDVTEIKYQPIHIRHAFALLNDDRTISKLGPQSENPTYIQTLEFELRESRIDESCILFHEITRGTIGDGELINPLEDLGNCKAYLQFYDCSQSAEKAFRKDIQQIYDEQKRIELDIEYCLKGSTNCDLTNLNVKVQNLENKILQKRLQIETNEGYIGNMNYNDIRVLEIRSDSIRFQLKLLKGEPII